MNKLLNLKKDRERGQKTWKFKLKLLGKKVQRCCEF